MTENLLQKLEEKMLVLLTELEKLRKEVQRVHQENTNMKNEKDHYAKKMQEFISLLDAINPSEQVKMNPSIQVVKPILVQEIQG